MSYIPVSGRLSRNRLTIHGAIVFSLRELTKLAGCDHMLSVQDDISGPTSGLSISEAFEQVVDEVNSIAPAGWEYVIDHDDQPCWEFNEGIVKEDLRNGR